MKGTIQIQNRNLHGWEAYELSSNQLSISVVPALGGRILSLQYCGEEFFFVQEKHAGETFDFSYMDKKALNAEKRKMGFRLWGGDKTWVAPQSEWSEGIPPLVLDAGQYTAKLAGQQISMLSAVDPETGVQISREVTLFTKDRLELKQGFHNHSDKVIERGIWDVSQILRNISVYVSVAPKEIIPYPAEGDSVALLEQMISPAKEGWTRIRCDEPAHFKYGANLKKGRLITFKPASKSNGFLMMERLFDLDPRAKYAHGVMVEVYNSPNMNYAEVEVHAPLKEIPPGGSNYHSQIWQFKQTSRESV